MNKIENTLLRGCGYTVIILFLFYVFGLIGGYTDAYINLPTFAIILAFGILISAAGLILKAEKIHIALRLLIHYATLLVAFCVIFMLTGNLSSGGDSVIFSSVVIFTFLYALVFAITCFISKCVKKADKSLGKKANASNSEKKKEKYKPIYKSED